MAFRQLLRECIGFNLSLRVTAPLPSTFTKSFLPTRPAAQGFFETDFLKPLGSNQSLECVEIDNLVFTRLIFLKPNFGRRRCKGI